MSYEDEDENEDESKNERDIASITSPIAASIKHTEGVEHAVPPSDEASKPIRRGELACLGCPSGTGSKGGLLDGQEQERDQNEHESFSSCGSPIITNTTITTTTTTSTNETSIRR